MTESEVAFYLRQLLVAVEYMHSQNVIHLDLKVTLYFLLWVKALGLVAEFKN